MKNYFQRSEENPYHISIGAVLVNKDGKVCCHHFEHINIDEIGEFEDLYILMRETIEPGETIETCLARGLQEEFGATGTLRSYMGSIVSYFPLKPDAPVIVEKTTLYFLCDLVSISPQARREGDPEGSSTLEWLSPQELIEKMKAQAQKYGREDADESKVLERLK